MLESKFDGSTGSGEIRNVRRTLVTRILGLFAGKTEVLLRGTVLALCCRRRGDDMFPLLVAFAVARPPVRRAFCGVRTGGIAKGAPQRGGKAFEGLVLIC